MNINMISSIGGFDRVFVDGSLNAMPPCGIEIRGEDSFQESLSKDLNSHEHGLVRLKLNIVGEIRRTGWKQSEYIQNSARLAKQGLRVVKIGELDRYSIGYASILVLEDSKIEDESIEKLAKDGADAGVYLGASRLAKQLAKSNDDLHVAILDRIYTNEHYRGYGVASWIHNNLRDLVRVYSLTDIGAVVLYYADFKGESGNKVTKEEYLDYLFKHYKKLGYKRANVLWTLEGIDIKQLMYKIL